MAATHSNEFDTRLKARYDELKWLYCELYNNDEKGFRYLCRLMKDYYAERVDSLKAIDRDREKNPDWYRGNDIVGMMLYVDNFAGNLKGGRRILFHRVGEG